MSIYCIKDTKVKSDVVNCYTSAQKKAYIIIDNGSFNCRVGWSTDSKPRLIYRNCYAKQRKDRKQKNINAEREILVANEISTLEANRFQLRFPHDENVVTHFEGQEIMLSYAFSHLGINTESVKHPIIITEAFCNPSYSRQCMSELLFECYNVPKVCYCVDSLLSFYKNSIEKDGIVINIGNWTTHIIPIINDYPDYQKSMRMRVGGQHLTKYLWRIMQLRFPHHLNAITISRAEEILFSLMHVAENYSDAMQLWSNPNYYEEKLKKIQLPYTAQTNTVSTPNSELQKERRKEAAKRLNEINAKKREEKLEEDLIEMTRLSELAEALEEFEPDEPEYQQALDEARVQSSNELRKKLYSLQQRIERTKMKIANQKYDDFEVEAKTSKLKNVSVPQKEEERKAWLSDLKDQWLSIQTRKSTRRKKRIEMAKRRTVASQERMRIITELARREKKEDDFGSRDEDWDVYKAINKEGGGSDSEEDDEKLQDLEVILKHYDPEFFAGSSKPQSVAENYQIYLATEQIQVPEILFQPSINGVDQGGISQTLEYLFKCYDSKIQARLASNIVVSGSGAKFPGLKERLDTDLMAMRPFQSEYNVRIANDPELDTWYGAKMFAPQIVENCITYKEYMEYGGDYLKNSKFGNNLWCPVKPKNVQAE